MTRRPTFRAVFRAEPAIAGREVLQLRELLKDLLRKFGFRAVELSEVRQEAEEDD